MPIRDTTVPKRELRYQKRLAYEAQEAKRNPYRHIPHASFFNSKTKEVGVTTKLLLATLLLSAPCGQRYEIDYSCWDGETNTPYCKK